MTGDATISAPIPRIRDRSAPGGNQVGSRIEKVIRRGCALVVAAIAAYASYEHQRSFALAGGADPTSARLWPLSVDGLVVLATVGLLNQSRGGRRRARVVVWLAFLTGIVVSLAANVAAAPSLAWQPVLVAGWPPVALLLAVELLAHPHRTPHVASDAVESSPAPAQVDVSRADIGSAAETGSEPNPRSRDRRGAEQAMWDHLQHELAQGRVPTGAELDRAAGTNNYGRRLLRKWRQQGVVPRHPTDQDCAQVTSMPNFDGASS